MCRNRLYLRENKLSAYFSDAIEDIADALGAYEYWKQIRVVGKSQ